MSDFNDFIDGGSRGAALTKGGTTVQTFALSLAAGFVLFGVQFSGFVIFRNYLWAKRIYQPRSFLIPLKNRVKPPPNNLIRWLTLIFKIQSDEEVLQKAGMDAYFFLRYLTMCLKIFFPLALIILPILIPLNVVGGKGTHTIAGETYNVTGLDKLAWSNVSPEKTSRYWAHLVLALVVIAWTCYLFHKELMHYIVKRQEYLGNPSHRLKASSTTVLITDIPGELCTTEALTELYDDLPGGIRRIWINKDLSSIVEKSEYRAKIENMLEDAETNLIRKIIKRSRKTKNQEPRNEQELDMRPLSDASERKLIDGSGQIVDEKIPGPTTAAMCQADLQNDINTNAGWTRHIKPSHRATMRIPNEKHKKAFKIPLIGRLFATKVDTIFYCRRELARLNQELARDVDDVDSHPSNNSAFIQFNTQKAAHLACQAIADTIPRRMLQRTVEMSPADVNWPSLNYSWSNRALRLLIFILLFMIVIFVFGIISFFTGILSKVSTLSGSTSWLRWIDDLPSWLLSFIQGTLPPVIQVIILSGPTPIVLRAMTNNTRGAVTGSQGERSLQLWYFIFLLLELFVIPTISSGLTSIVQQIIQSTTSIPAILARNLPTAANYYFSFLIVQALSISASSIFQTVRMFNFYVIGGVNTPDALFKKLTFTHLTRIGSNIPWYTTFAVIGIVYSVIAPLMLVFVLITFSLFWIVIKNNVLFVVRTGNVDSGGLWFPSAINQTFTGLYFMEACLIGLFFLVRDAANTVACEAQGTIMAVSMVLTVLYQLWLQNNFSGLVKYAPLRLEGLALEQERDWEMKPLTVPELDFALAQDKIIEDGLTTSLGRENLQVPTSQQDMASEHDGKLGEEQRRRRRSTVKSAVIADRSRFMQAQKERDKQRAKHILARLNRPLDETRLAALENRLSAAEAKIGNVFLPKQRDIEARMMNDPISKIIMQHNDELEDLSAEERDMLVSIAFTHPVLREIKPSVWIPQDDIGVSEDEVKRTRELSRHLDIENRGAFFNKKLKVQIDKPPPDMSEFALIIPEL